MKQTHTSLGKTSLTLPSAWSPFPWPHVALGPLGEAAGRQEMGSARAGSCSCSRPSGAIPLSSAPACTFFLLASHSSHSGLVHLGFFGVYCPLLNMFSQRLYEVFWFRGGTHVADGARPCSVVGVRCGAACVWHGTAPRLFPPRASPQPLATLSITPCRLCLIHHSNHSFMSLYEFALLFLFLVFASLAFSLSSLKIWSFAVVR